MGAPTGGAHETGLLPAGLAHCWTPAGVCLRHRRLVHGLGQEVRRPEPVMFPRRRVRRLLAVQPVSRSGRRRPLQLLLLLLLLLLLVLLLLLLLLLLSLIFVVVAVVVVVAVAIVVAVAGAVAGVVVAVAVVAVVALAVDVAHVAFVVVDFVFFVV